MCILGSFVALSFSLTFPYDYLVYSFCSAKEGIVEERDEQQEFETGPLSVLMQSVKQNTQVSYYSTRGIFF